jgi:pimeloyl-ACP methyl ester carboxylesterase
MPPFRLAISAVAMCAALATGVGHAQAPAPTPSAAAHLFAGSHIVALDRISVEVIGQGLDVIFIPGLASSREVWRATAERLRARYRLHLVQVAGFAGESARANASGDVVTPTAEAIDAYIVSQKLSPAVVVGHSLGGTMALYLAEHHPEHLKKVLLVDALPFFAVTMLGPQATPDQVRPIAAAIRAGPPQSDATAAKMIAAMVTGEADRKRVAGWSKASDPTVVKDALADDLLLDLRPSLAAIPTPITLLYPDYAAVGMTAGAADSLYSAAYAPVPDKTLKRVEQSLHFIMLDQPQVFSADLDAFLAK